MKILIIDDSELSRNALEAILKQAGYNDIITCESASKGIEFLCTPDQPHQDECVDLILMDVMMPEMDGIQAVKAIKGMKHLKDIPIVMVSVQDEEERIQNAFDAGAIDYVNKPIKKLELLARVRSILKLKEETDQRKIREKELEDTLEQLLKAMAEVKALSGLLPICSNCKNIRDDNGYWLKVERYISERSDATFSHSICPDCTRKLYPEIADEVLGRDSE